MDDRSNNEYRNLENEKNEFENIDNSSTETAVGGNFVMRSPEPKREEFFTETYKEPKKKKGGFIKFIAAVLIISVFGGAGIGAGYGIVKYAVAGKGNSATKLETTKGEAITLSTKEPNAAVEVINRVFPSVVNISISGTTNQNYYGFVIPYEYTSAGSGIVFSEDENKIYIATNNHVVDGASSISVSIAEEDGVVAKVGS